jgi:cytochrome c-type biogenesis protein
MFDATGAALREIHQQSPLAVGLVFVAGLISSVGPCVAPRFIAVAGLAAGTSRRRALVTTAAFICGITVTYAAFGALAPLLNMLVRSSSYFYGVLAFILVWSGFRRLYKTESCYHSAHISCAGPAFFLGASSALVVSPCCAPIVMAIAAYAGSYNSIPYSCGLLAAFSLGHALPLLAAATGARAAAAYVSAGVQQAAATVGGALMIALGAYFGALS